MDQLTDVLLSVQLDSSVKAERWFTLIQGSFARSVPQCGWEEYAAELQSAAASAGFAAEAEEFIRYMSEHIPDPMGMVAAMDAEGDRLTWLYGQAWHASAGETGGRQAAAGDERVARDNASQSVAVEDPDAWNSYLAGNGPRWDGAGESWPQFREWFLYHAAEQHVGQSAQGFIGYVEDQEDKPAAFAAYGVQVGGYPPAAAGPAADSPAPAVHAPADSPQAADQEAGPDVGDMPAASSAATEEILADFAGPVIAEFREQYPEFERMDDGQLRELLRQVIDERR